MVTIHPGNAAMAMTHVFAQANICDHDQLGAPGFDRTDRLLHDAVFRVGRTGQFVLVLRNTKEQNGLKAEIVGALRFRRRLCDGKLKNARHARDWLPPRHTFADKKRKHEIVRTELCFADEISQACALTQTARPMDQFSHAPRLDVTLKGRKLIAGRCASDPPQDGFAAENWRT